MAKFYNRAKVTCTTAGTGTLTLGAALSNAWCTFAEAGASDGETVAYLIENGTDFEIGTGVYTAAGTTLTRASVTISKIGGTQGTTKITLAGTSTVSIIARKEDLANLGQTNTFTADQIWAAGTTTLAPTKFQSGTNLTSAVAGAEEYDGTCKYFTPNTSNRGVSLTELFLSLSANQTGTNVSTAQTMFPGGGSTTLTLPASTSYFFEILFWASRAAGTTSHTTSFLFGGTATFTSIMYDAFSTENSVAQPAQSATTITVGAVATATVITGISTDTTENHIWDIKGIFRINGAGTIIPQFKYSAAPGGAPTVKANTFFRCRPIGSNTVLSVGNWS